MSTLEAMVERSKPSIDGFELPCGYMDSTGHLHNYIELTELTGNEEEILASKKMPIMKKMNRILANCTKSLGDINDRKMIEAVIPELTQGDRLFMLFAIRRVTLGDEFPMVVKCPSCDKDCRITADLSTLETKKMPDPKLRVYEIILPKSKKKVMMKVLTGRGEEAISKANVDGGNVISVAILARTESIDGKPANINDILNMSMMDRNALRDAWNDKEGGIDTAVGIDCPYCEHSFEADVEIADKNFFSPSQVQKP